MLTLHSHWPKLQCFSAVFGLLCVIGAGMTVRSDTVFSLICWLFIWMLCSDVMRVMLWVIRKKHVMPALYPCYICKMVFWLLSTIFGTMKKLDKGLSCWFVKFTIILQLSLHQMWGNIIFFAHCSLLHFNQKCFEQCKQFFLWGYLQN